MASLRTMHPDAYRIAQSFVRWLQSNGVRVTVTSTFRDQAKQARLYAAYKAGRSKFPAAPPGRSTHGQGIAFDLHLEPAVYRQAGLAWEAAGFTWGGRFNDPIHFDLRPRR